MYEKTPYEPNGTSSETTSPEIKEQLVRLERELEQKQNEIIYLKSVLKNKVTQTPPELAPELNNDFVSFTIASEFGCEES